MSNLASIVVPKEEVLARDQCEDYGLGKPIWGTQPLTLDQGSVVGHIEEAVMVEESDEIWEEEKEPTVRTMILAEI